MILDDHDDRHRNVEVVVDDELAAGVDDAGDDEGEWLAGLRRAGLPLRTPAAAITSDPSSAVRQLVDDSWQLAATSASADVRALVEASIAESTRAAYEEDWLGFVAWCRVHDLDDPLTATDITVAEYVAELVRARLAMATIRRRLAAIAFAFHLTRRPTPTQSALVTRTLAGAARTLGTSQDRAAPLRLEAMRAIVRGLPIVRAGQPAMRRDQLLVGLGWATALRASELVALDADDLRFRGDPDRGEGGVLVRIRRSKTDQTAHVEWVAVPYASQWTGCPVRLALTWTRHHRRGPLFRHIDRHGRAQRRLGADAVSRLLKTVVHRVLQDDPGPYSSHSLRAGFVTEARSYGIPDELIARHTRHALPGRRRASILDVYDRPDDLLERTAFDGWW